LQDQLNEAQSTLTKKLNLLKSYEADLEAAREEKRDIEKELKDL
jgi:hypothetical protein